jgi:hypothetical protein
MEDERIVEHAERQLYALASQLRNVPASGPTRELHLRALQLKRELARWRTQLPDPAVREAVFSELEELIRLTRKQPDRSRLAFTMARAAGKPPGLGHQPA